MTSYAGLFDLTGKRALVVGAGGIGLEVAKALAATAGTPAPPNVEADLPLLSAMKDLVAKIDALERDLRDVPGWSALSTDVTRMAFATNLAESLRTHLIPLASAPKHLVKLRHETQKLVVDGNDLLAPNGPIAEAVGEIKRKSTADVAAQTTRNARALFRLPA